MSLETKMLLIGKQICKAGVVFAVLALLPLTRAQAQNQNQGYTVTDLGTLGGPSSFALGINNNLDQVQVVGAASIEFALQARRHAFLWENGSLRDLMVPHRDSEARGINDAGQVAVLGIEGIPGVTNVDFFAYVWRAGILTPLFHPVLRTTNVFCEPRAINSFGNVVGKTVVAGEIHATFWSGPAAIGRDLGTLGPGFTFSDAFDINNLGQIVGESSSSSFPFLHRAFLDDGTGMQDLGSLPGSQNSRAFAINDLGQVVGDTEGGRGHAFLYDGDMQELPTLAGTPNCTAFGINNVTQVVGACFNISSQSWAVLWENGVVKRLGDLVPADSGWDGSGAREFKGTAINDAGQIAVSGGPHALLLTPITVGSLSFNPNPVPGGTNSVGTVTLSGKAPPAGVVVALLSGDPSVQVAASVMVPAGQTSATFPVTTIRVINDTAVDITATVNGVDTVSTLLLTAS
jgi:probable HAF family extracellular repeat protein